MHEPQQNPTRGEKEHITCCLGGCHLGTRLLRGHPSPDRGRGVRVPCTPPTGFSGSPPLKSWAAPLAPPRAGCGSSSPTPKVLESSQPFHSSVLIISATPSWGEAFFRGGGGEIEKECWWRGGGWGGGLKLNRELRDPSKGCVSTPVKKSIPAPSLQSQARQQQRRQQQQPVSSLRGDARASRGSPSGLLRAGRYFMKAPFRTLRRAGGERRRAPPPWPVSGMRRSPRLQLLARRVLKKAGVAGLLSLWAAREARGANGEGAPQEGRRRSLRR